MLEFKHWKNGVFDAESAGRPPVPVRDDAGVVRDAITGAPVGQEDAAWARLERLAQRAAHWTACVADEEDLHGRAERSTRASLTRAHRRFVREGLALGLEKEQIISIIEAACADELLDSE